MKKFGFTLTEILITMSIISVVAVISAPTFSNLVPNKDKAMVIKASKIINDTVQSMLNDNSLYPGDTDDPTCVGLDCTGYPYNPEIVKDTSHKTQYQGIPKFTNLFAKKLDYITTPNSSTLFTNKDFQTSDYITWTVKYYEASSLSNNTYGGGGAIITIDLDDATKSANCIYNSSSCKFPDRFQFFVSNRGMVRANDPLTKAYLNNPTKLGERNKDFATAKGISMTPVKAK